MGILTSARNFFVEPKYKDVDLRDSTGTVHAKVNFSQYGWRFKDAQVKLDSRIMLDMQPYIAFRTGRLQGAIQMENNSRRGTGQIVVYTLPYGRKVYVGVNENTGQPMHYTNPLTTPYWFNTVKQIHGKEWKELVARVLRSGTTGRL